jgi:hypothetical protein
MPVADATIGQLIGHVARGTTNSPYISLTRSFGVARNYALLCRTPYVYHKKGFVYVVELDKRSEIELRDPVKEIGRLLNKPYDEPSYHHDGSQNFLLGVSNPVSHGRDLSQPISQPPPGEGTPRPANLHPHFETIVRSLRDAEILALRAVPRKFILDRFEVN